MARRSLHLVLVLSLLLLSWFQLQHELKAHAGQPDQGCEICVFTGHLGHGAPATIATPGPVHIPFHFELARYDAPTLEQRFRHVQSERGPPLPTPA